VLQDASRLVVPAATRQQRGACAAGATGLPGGREVAAGGPSGGVDLEKLWLLGVKKGAELLPPCAHMQEAEPAHRTLLASLGMRCGEVLPQFRHLTLIARSGLVDWGATILISSYTWSWYRWFKPALVGYGFAERNRGSCRQEPGHPAAGGIVQGAMPLMFGPRVLGARLGGRGGTRNSAIPATGRPWLGIGMACFPVTR
jgi:hypothetical protein